MRPVYSVRRVLYPIGLLTVFLFLNVGLISAQTDSTQADTTEAVAVDTLKDISEETVFLIVEERAEFPGGDASLYQFLANNVDYPRAAIEAGIQGRVLIQFTVNTDGSLTDFEVVSKKIGYGLEEAAMKAVTRMPKWKPATREGKPVRMRFAVPVTFKLT